ncbi:hypothetical protein PEXP_059180 [Penicillium expansum]|nr:hypothetical protein PEXP_059180 [Penicillium expansum]
MKKDHGGTEQWAPGEGLEEKDDEANEGYFQIHPYFEADSCQSECSSRFPWVLSPAATDSEIIVGSDLKKGPNTMCGQQRLTEDLVEQIPEHILRQEDIGEWITTLSSNTNETETPNIPSTASNTPDNPNHHIHQQTLSKKKSGPSSPTQTIQEYIDPLTTSEKKVHDETIGRIWGYLLPIYEGMDHEFVLQNRSRFSGVDEVINDNPSKLSLPQGYLFGRDPESGWSTHVHHC